MAEGEERSDGIPLTVISVSEGGDDEALRGTASADPASSGDAPAPLGYADVRHDAPIPNEEREVAEWASLCSVVLLGVIIALLAQAMLVASQRSEPATATCAPCFDPPSYTVTPRSSSPVLLRNGTLWLGDRFLRGDLLMTNGRITSIATSVEPPTNARVVDLDGAVVTPGLIDAHSHAGALSYPTDLKATRGDNEATNPIFPQLRVEDAYDTNDLALPDLLSWGVTAHMILPGSKDLIGGATVVVRVRPRVSLSEARVAGAREGVKIAVGQNPKQIWGSQNKSPQTRMGEAWLLRQVFEQAAQLKQAQDAWCAAGCSGPAPQDSAIEHLVEVLRGTRHVHVHVYQTNDMEMMMRIAAEFNFTITAIHHATEAWLQPELVKQMHATVCLFTDSRWYRWEARRASAVGINDLIDEDVPVAVISDHDNHLMAIHEAALLWHVGVAEHTALAAITSVPAAVLGVADRMGTLAEGMDADVVVWDRHPLRIGAHPTRVMQEGEVAWEAPLPAIKGLGTLPSIRSVLMRKGAPVIEPVTMHSSLYAITGATVWTMDSDTPLTAATVIVRNGTVQCIGSAQACPLPGDLTEYFSVPTPEDRPDTQGTVLPGLIYAGTPLGQSVMGPAYGIDSDGAVGAPGSQYVRASDGVSPALELVRDAFLGGVTVSVNLPLGDNLIAGLSVAWETHGRTLDEALIKDEVALHVRLGYATKNSRRTSSISAQVSLLRQRFKAAVARNDTSDPMLRVAQGTLLLVAHVQSADQISAMLALKGQFGFRMTIYGGSEAHIVADELAISGVSVILSPVSCSPWQRWPERRCSLAAAAILHRAGVQIGLSPHPDAAVWLALTPARWLAGLAHAYGLPYATALKALTSSMAEALDLEATGVGRVAVGAPANLVLYGADPLEIGSVPLLVAVGAHLELAPPLP